MMRWLLVTMWLIAGAALAEDQQHGMHGGASPMRPGAKMAQFAAEMGTAMDTMMRDMHAPGHTGKADIDFLAMMIPHHEGAVEMARLVLIHGHDPLTRKLAEEIIASQVVEIGGMKRRLAILRAKTGPGQGEFPALGGTRGPGQ